MSPEGASLHLRIAVHPTVNTVAPRKFTYMMELALSALVVLFQMCFKRFQVHKDAQKAGHYGIWMLVPLTVGNTFSSNVSKFVQ